MASRRFVILGELGRGGHGRVYRARDEQLGRVIAVKVLHAPHPAGDRLIKEARALCQLSHPGVVCVYDVGQIIMTAGSEATITLTEDGDTESEQTAWAILMEDLGSIDPRSYVRDHGAREALRIVADIAEAMQAVHAAGMIHGDLNPNNIRIVRGQAKVFDFSLAARVPGRPYGTPAYRAPEQTRGEDPTDRTDVYGLGRLLHALLSEPHGVVLPNDTDAAQPPPIRALSWHGRKSVERLLRSMLDPIAVQRPSMQHVAKMCRQAIGHHPGWRRAFVAASAALLVGIVGAGMLTLRRSTIPTPERAAGPARIPTSDAFAATLRVHGPAGPADAIPEASGSKVVLDLERDRRTATIDAQGEATFKEIPGRFLGQRIPIAVQVPGYTPSRSARSLVLTDAPIYFALDRDPVPPPARLRVAIGLVHHGRDVLMVRRRHREGNLSWQFPAGIVKPLQEPEQRVVDETLKETGISIKPLNKIGERISPDTRAHAIYFDCAYLGGAINNGDPDENVEVAWVPAREVETRVTSSLYAGVTTLLRNLGEGHAD